METKTNDVLDIHHEYFVDYVSRRICRAKDARYEDQANAWIIVDELLEAINKRQGTCSLSPSELELLGQISKMVIAHAPEKPLTNIDGDTHSSRSDMLQKIQSINIYTVDSNTWKEAHTKNRTKIEERLEKGRKSGDEKKLIKVLYQSIKYYKEVKPQSIEEWEFLDSLVQEYNKINSIGKYREIKTLSEDI